MFRAERRAEAVERCPTAEGKLRGLTTAPCSPSRCGWRGAAMRAPIAEAFARSLRRLGHDSILFLTQRPRRGAAATNGLKTQPATSVWDAGFFQLHHEGTKPRSPGYPRLSPVRSEAGRSVTTTFWLRAFVVKLKTGPSGTGPSAVPPQPRTCNCSPRHACPHRLGRPPTAPPGGSRCKARKQVIHRVTPSAHRVSQSRYCCVLVSNAIMVPHS